MAPHLAGALIVGDAGSAGDNAQGVLDLIDGLGPVLIECLQRGRKPRIGAGQQGLNATLEPEHGGCVQAAARLQGRLGRKQLLCCGGQGGHAQASGGERRVHDRGARVVLSDDELFRVVIDVLNADRR